jgi:DNA-binding response OmpR family regulator
LTDILGSKKSVVVMDDSEVVRLAVAGALEDSGYAVRGAADLRELEAALAAGAPDLLVLDVQMPEMFGDDVALVLRQVRSMRVPIILFSGIEEAALAERGRESGADAWVTKGAGVEGLLEKVALLAGR